MGFNSVFKGLIFTLWMQSDFSVMNHP